MVKLIDADEWSKLLPGDQLRAQMAAGHAFASFEESECVVFCPYPCFSADYISLLLIDKIAFKPTFKLNRSDGFHYNVCSSALC